MGSEMCIRDRAGLVGCYSCWLFMSRSWCARPFLNGLWLGRFDAGVSDTLLLGASILAWLWMTLLTLVPAALFASANEGAHDAGASRGAGGVACLVMALWALGWGFLWSHWRPVYTGSFDVEEFVCEGFRDKGIQPIGEQQRLAHMPPDWLLRLKFVSVVGECYNYCGFSFFPALPWRAMQTPPSVPHPQAIMLAGFLDFGDLDTRFWIFVGAAATVMLGFILLALQRDNPSRRFLITQVFFELLSFPLIKTLTGVFSCTSAGIWAEPEFGTQRGATLVCEETVPDGAQCMDMSHAVVCWTSGTHHGYLATVVVLLVPYYMACLHLQLAANRAQSAVSIDGTWSITVTQCKFMLAIIASSFGDCYPIIIAVSMQLVVICLLYTSPSPRDGLLSRMPSSA